MAPNLPKGLNLRKGLDPLERIMAGFDITGQGTCLSEAPSSAASAPSTPLASKAAAAEHKDAAASDRRARTSSRVPNKKQQMTHALKVQSAHMITTDYVALSMPLVDGMLLMDRTEHKLKLIRSLGELQPQHTYTTEYGNTLRRTSKYKVMLADSIELDVTSDEADYDAAMAKLALAGSSNGSLSTSMRMAAYDAIAHQSEHVHQGDDANGAPSANGTNGAAAAASTNGAVEAEALQEQEAMQRIEALVLRMGEMETWFDGVRAEAERERRMREQAVQRLSLLSERLDRTSSEMDALRAENVRLRERLHDLGVAQEEAKALHGADTRPALMATSLNDIHARAVARGPIL